MSLESSSSYRGFFKRGLTPINSVIIPIQLVNKYLVKEERPVKEQGMQGKAMR